MRGLGRLIALPWLLIALAVQGFAPAQAQAMPRDAFGLPICSGRAHGGDQQRDPQHGQAHDCCAAACARAGLGGAPPALPQPSRIVFADTVAFASSRHPDIRGARLDRPPNARAPPASSLTN